MNNYHGNIWKFCREIPVGTLKFVTAYGSYDWAQGSLKVFGIYDKVFMLLM